MLNNLKRLFYKVGRCYIRGCLFSPFWVCTSLHCWSFSSVITGKYVLHYTDDVPLSIFGLSKQGSIKVKGLRARSKDFYLRSHE